MSSIGQIIKHERLSRKMKQVDLAEGICSVSHLSKIENNFTVPSDEVVQMLLQKLNIQLEDITNENENKFINSLYKLYKESVIRRDKQLIREYIQQFTGKKIHFKELSNFYSYNLYMFRLFLILDESVEELAPFIDALKAVENQFNEIQQFIYNLNVGLYDYLTFNFHKATLQLEKSFVLIEKLTLKEWEKADFYNVISLTYLKVENNFGAIVYAEKSLAYYKDNLLLERAIDSYNTIGIAQKRLLEYKKSEESFKLGLKLANNLNLPYYMGILYQNLGSLYGVQGKHKKALEHFKLSIEIKDECKYVESYLVTIHSIIQEYSKENNPLQIIRWCDKGLEVIGDKLNTKVLFKTYNHHFNIYKSLHSINDDLENTLEKAIKFFEKIHDTKHVMKYSILLGDFYYKMGRFNSAADYYQKSNAILFKQKNITKWQDL